MKLLAPKRNPNETEKVTVTVFLSGVCDLGIEKSFLGRMINL